MAELKTKPTVASVNAFLAKVAGKDRRGDCKTILQMMKKVSRKEPKMWGSSMVGFGEYHYKYASGHEGDCFVIGFAPRKQDLTLYFMGGLDRHKSLLKKLGKHRTGKACLYIKKLADVDLDVLDEMLRDSVQAMKVKA